VTDRTVRRPPQAAARTAAIRFSDQRTFRTVTTRPMRLARSAASSGGDAVHLQVDDQRRLVADPPAHLGVAARGDVAVEGEDLDHARERGGRGLGVDGKAVDAAAGHGTHPDWRETTERSLEPDP
jgi:hypothetical protein